MRKLFVLSALMLSALGASAQTAIVNNFKNFGVVPGYLTQDGMAVGYSVDFGVDFYEGSALEAPGEVTIVDNDFKAQKSFTLNRRQVGYNYKKETFPDFITFLRHQIAQIENQRVTKIFR